MRRRRLITAHFERTAELVRQVLRIACVDKSPEVRRRNRRLWTGWRHLRQPAGELWPEIAVIERAGAIYDKPRAITLDHEALRVFQACGLADVMENANRAA